MTARRTLLALIPLAGLLAAASPPADADPDELIRRANDAFARDDLAEADRLYEAAEALTADPGLVAFNRAAVLFRRAEATDRPEHYAEAAGYYQLALADASCPPERAARAWYNRGTCLLRQPGASTAVYRSAIACLERCRASDAADPPLKANAAYNLRLAKLLWDEARQREKTDDNPNKDFPPEDPRNEPPLPQSLGQEPRVGEPEPGAGNDGTGNPQAGPQQVAWPGAKAAAAKMPTPAPGQTGQLQPLEDRREIQPLTPEQTREQLRQTAERLRKARNSMRMMLYGLERPGLHDW
jgi:tetratricopeptide (TPR) repeat protein